MSVASEYNSYMDRVRFYCPNSGELVAKVESEFECFGFRWVHMDTFLEPEEALALAQWIFNTFGKAQTDIKAEDDNAISRA